MHSDPAPRATRLELAFDAGLELPDSGWIAVFHPRAGEILSVLPGDQLAVLTPHAPDAAAFSAFVRDLGPDARFAAALVCLPRSKEEGQALIAEAVARTDGLVIVDGQKTDGIEAALKALRARVDLSEVLSKGHGKIAWFEAGDARDTFDDWTAKPRDIHDDTGRVFQTQPGLFSADGIDPASQLLANTLPATLKGIVADLGAGWGVLSAAALSKADGITELHLVESDARALDMARQNVRDPRAHFLWADATRPLGLIGKPLYDGHTPPALSFDAVIMNPPFHVGRDTRPQLGAEFIRAASRLLKPSGQLWLVANRHLPYEPIVAECFKSHEEVAGTTGFKVLHAQGPGAGTTHQSPAKRGNRSVKRGRRG